MTYLQGGRGARGARLKKIKLLRVIGVITHERNECATKVKKLSQNG